MHKAIKVAVAVTTGLAIDTAIGNGQLSLFASFGGVALLLFADFPGGRTVGDERVMRGPPVHAQFVGDRGHRP